jgi:mannosyltransferase
VTIKLLYDDIIYQLQQAGGISTYWKEITARIAKNERFDVFFTKGSRLTRYLPIFSQVNIFHSSYYRLNLSPQTKNVITVYDFLYELGFLKTVGSPINIFQRKIAIKQADAIICISENTKKDLLSFYPELAHHPPIYVVTLASSFKIINDSNNIINSCGKRLESLKQATSGQYILFVGSRISRKNFKAALWGFSNSELPQLGYSMVCTGARFSVNEEKSIQKLGVQNKVFVLEYADDSELNYLYQHAFALVYPSSYEGFGLPPLEAMNCGCPVIAVNTSSIPEVVGEAGILLGQPDVDSIKNALESLLNHEVRRSYINKGLERAKLFSWDRAADQCISIYQSLVND